MIDPELREAPISTRNRKLRQFAGLWFLILGGLAGWQGLIHEHWARGLILGGLAVLVGVVGLTKPQAVRPLFTGLIALTYPMGWLVSHLLLAIMFYGMFTPMALSFRLIGRDALSRRRRPERTSHWLPKPRPSDVRSYFRQS